MGAGRLIAGLRSVLTALVLAPTLSACAALNAIPALEERAKAAWSEVQNHHQRRADLVPKLVEAVKSFAQQEREVLQEVTEARARAAEVKVDASTVNDPETFKNYEEAQNRLSSALTRLLVTVERYPELKSSNSFLAVQKQLQDIEDRIAVARRDYTDAVRAYNRELRTMPGRWIAALMYPDARPMANFTVTRPPRA